MWWALSRCRREPLMAADDYMGRYWAWMWLLMLLLSEAVGGIGGVFALTCLFALYGAGGVPSGALLATFLWWLLAFFFRAVS